MVSYNLGFGIHTSMSETMAIPELSNMMISPYCELFESENLYGMIEALCTSFRLTDL